MVDWELHPGFTQQDFLDRIEQAKSNAEIILHPNGFLQLPLGNYPMRPEGELRLHIWSADIPVRGDKRFSIHDHIFDIESRILCGSLTDCRYDVVESQEGTHLVYQSDGNGQLLRTKTLVDCNLALTKTFGANDNYTIPRQEFHASLPLEPLTATLIMKSHVGKKLKSRVIVPREYTGEAISVDRSISQDIAWKLVERVYDEVYFN